MFRFDLTFWCGSIQQSAISLLRLLYNFYNVYNLGSCLSAINMSWLCFFSPLLSSPTLYFSGIIIQINLIRTAPRLPYCHLYILLFAWERSNSGLTGAGMVLHQLLSFMIKSFILLCCISGRTETCSSCSKMLIILDLFIYSHLKHCRTFRNGLQDKGAFLFCLQVTEFF